MTDEEALIAAVHLHPDDDLPQLILADWYEEFGYPDRAAYLRERVALCRMSYASVSESIERLRDLSVQVAEWREAVHLSRYDFLNDILHPIDDEPYGTWGDRYGTSSVAHYEPRLSPPAAEHVPPTPAPPPSSPPPPPSLTLAQRADALENHLDPTRRSFTAILRELDATGEIKPVVYRKRPRS